VPFEAESIGRLVDGFRQIHEDDDVLLERGIEMIEALYRSSGSPKPTKPASADGLLEARTGARHDSVDC
jgi:hypothetical protein